MPADETCRHLLDLLRDPALRDPTLPLVAQWKLEGYRNGEIAAMLGCVRRSVERKVRVIQSVWQQEEGLR